MKSCLSRLLLLSCLLVCAITAHAQAQASPSQSDTAAPLTNAAVMKLAHAGFSEKTIIAIIGARPAHFDLAPDRLIELKKHGVSEKVILAMIARDNGTRVLDDMPDDSLADDPFFNPDRTKHPAGADSSARNGDPNETNIFGSSGGAHGRSSTNGIGGGQDGETQTTGSATVRILRPPAEEGGAPPKLERTPTLNNDAIIELVAAGFSEGTIIRRIESSPADFDLSPAKLAELRRRRVTEPVINAMRAAMNDDAPASGTNAQPKQ
jgi:hypothetical protein